MKNVMKKVIAVVLTVVAVYGLMSVMSNMADEYRHDQEVAVAFALADIDGAHTDRIEYAINMAMFDMKEQAALEQAEKEVSAMAATSQLTEEQHDILVENVAQLHIANWDDQKAFQRDMKEATTPEMVQYAEHLLEVRNAGGLDAYTHFASEFVDSSIVNEAMATAIANDAAVMNK